MKATGTSLWYTTNQRATNISGFTGLPGGKCNYWDGSFENEGDFGYFWTSTAYDFIYARFCYLYYDLDDVYGVYDSRGRLSTPEFPGQAVNCQLKPEMIPQAKGNRQRILEYFHIRISFDLLPGIMEFF